MNPELPKSYAAFYTQLTTVISGLIALPDEDTWESHVIQYREGIQHLIDTLHYMLVSVHFVFEPKGRDPDVLGVFADELAHYTPKPNEGRMRHLGDHRSYAIRRLHAQLIELLGLERTWTLRQPYVKDMISELAETLGPRKGRLVMVRKAIGKLRLPQ